MTDYLPGLISIIVLIAIIYWVRRSQQQFIIEIEPNSVKVLRGNVDEPFVTDIRRICQLWSIDSGRIIGIKAGGGRVRIKVSGQILKSHRQTFQNAWNHQGGGEL